MLKLVCTLGRALLVLLGLQATKKPEARVWNLHAEFSCVIYEQGDNVVKREYVFKKDTLNYTVTYGGTSETTMHAFSSRHQDHLIKALERNRFFYLPDCEKSVLQQEANTVFTYTKDHFRKQVCVPLSSRHKTRLKKICAEMSSILTETGIYFPIPDWNSE